jgi:hypothetical protein
MRLRYMIAAAAIATATFAGAVLPAGTAAAQVPAQPGEPVTLEFYNARFPANIPRFTAFRNQRVDFRVVVDTRRVGVDVTRITPLTDFAIDLAATCLGREPQPLAQVGGSPLSSRDDLLVTCPLRSRGDNVIGAIGILAR